MPRIKRLLKWLAVTTGLLLLTVILLAATGVLDGWMQRAIMARIEQATGARVELQSFSFGWSALRAELTRLTLRGSEPQGTPPLFRADRVVVDLRVVSLFGGKMALDEIILDRPAVHVRIGSDGRSNFPGPRTPARPPAQPWQHRLIELAIGKMRWNDGELLWNDVRVPLAAEGQEFTILLDGQPAAAGSTAYRVALAWKQVALAARRYRPFRSDLEMKVHIEREHLNGEINWKLPHSEFKASGEARKLAPLDAEFQLGGTVSLQDVRDILRKPNSPSGVVEFSANGHHRDGRLELRGRYAARDLALPYTWFHASGISVWGPVQVAGRRLELPRFDARALGGSLHGRMQLDLAGPAFRVDSQVRGLDLAALLAAVDHESFPIGALNWQGRVDVDARTAWVADFKRITSTGSSVWAASHQAGGIPASARMDFEYSMDRKDVVLRNAEISTPSSRLRFDGRLGSQDSNAAVTLESGDLLPWNNFINALRGVRPAAQTRPERIAGQATFVGSIAGPLDGPEFVGRVHALRSEYGRMSWDEFEGDIFYSPRGFRLERARARRGTSSAALDLWLELERWGFRPESRWSLDAVFERAATQELQVLFGSSYPANGLLTGRFTGGGTRAAPEFAGRFDIADGQALGWRFQRARGLLELTSELVRVSGAELLAPAGRITGHFLYRSQSRDLEFAADADSLSIERFDPVEAGRLPVGGQLSFQIRGSGPLASPVSEGSLRILNLRTGRDVLGRLDGHLRSDGRLMRVDLVSAMSSAKIEGALDLTLGGEYPMSGNLVFEGFDLDALLERALGMGLTGHSRTDGRLRFSGAGARASSIAVDAELSRLTFDYRSLKLENEGPLRLAYRDSEIRIERAHIRGPVTDVRLSGFAQMAGDRSLGLQLAGTVNLQLLGGIWPQLEARGAADVSAAIAGTWASPRITGKLRVENTAANYGEFPAGLSEVTGEFVFDQSRLLFENVRASAGGGLLLLSGAVTYADGPLHYEIAGQATRVRIRYPEGMGWLAGGRLQFAGTTRAAVLSGRIIVDRVTLAPGFDLLTVMGGGGSVRTPAAVSPFLRNLQFDVEAASSPGARMEWSGARIESEASLRVRGTWEHPIILGHIHLLSGEMQFRGNRYRLSRGDIHFANPFRPDPVLNVEATTTVRQYDVTLNLSGQASKLALAYRSDPPLPSGDILAMLALGRTGEESELRTTVQGQTTELGASTLLSEAISSQLGGRIERLFGVSRFKVDPFLAGAGGEQNASARITIEQQLSRDLVVTYVTNVTSSQHQVIQIEYAVNRDLSIVALRDQNGTFGLDFKWKKRFK